MADIFLSYTRSDRVAAQKLVDSLTSEGWTVFWDYKIPIGEDWDSVIEEELKNARRQLEEADQLQAEVSKRLADVESEVTALKEKAAADGEAEAARINQQTKAEEERFLRRVDDEISRREAETRARLAQDTADLTAQLARDLLDREITDEDRRRVFERSLEAMTKLGGKE